MKKIDYKEILETAKKYNKNKIKWHHHFLSKQCVFNKNKEYKVILENEKTSEAFFCVFHKNPLRELKQLETLFFSPK